MTAINLDYFSMLIADGVRHMGTDEWLLERAMAGQAAMRFYRWSEATLSLGYFQHVGDRDALPLLGKLPLVRRATGGGAILHHHELTYALALPADHHWHGPETWMCRMHLVIGLALKTLGIETSLCDCGQAYESGDFLCFRHHSPGDLLFAGRKIVGSAQRKRRGAILQHGSILLAASPYVPEVPGIDDLTGNLIEADDLAARIAEQFTRTTGWNLTERSWPLEPIEQVNRYCDSNWTYRR